jgi:hypothetical protein
MKRVLIATSLLLFPVPATAAAFTCVGTVNYLGISNAGYVILDNGNGVWTICNLTNTYGSTTKEACAAWYSGLLTARASQRTVTLYFSTEDNSGITTCPALGTWTSRFPYFVQLD